MKYLLAILLLTGCGNNFDPEAIHNSYKDVSKITCELGATQVLYRMRIDGKITMKEYIKLYKPAAIYECDKVIKKVYGK